MSTTQQQLRAAIAQLESHARAADTCAANALRDHDEPDYACVGRHTAHAAAMRAGAAVLRQAMETAP